MKLRMTPAILPAILEFNNLTNRAVLTSFKRVKHRLDDSDGYPLGRLRLH